MNTTTPPGWYPDPNDPQAQRYWDGSQWTEHTSGGTAETAAASPQHAATQVADTAALQAAQAASPAAAETPQPAIGQQPAAPVGSSRTSGKAVTALVTGIIGLIIFPIVLSVLAVIFGVLARKETSQDPALGGRGMATAGLVMGIIGILFIPVWILLVF